MGARQPLLSQLSVLAFLPSLKSRLVTRLRTALALLFAPFRVVTTIIRYCRYPPRPVKKALLIGIIYREPVRDFLELPGTSNDVARLRDLLIARFGYRIEDIVVMTDDNEEVAPRLKPTKTNIVREIRSLIAGSQDGDHFLFYFAGHSEQVPCKHGSEEDGTDETLVCADAKRIKDNTLRKLLVNRLPKGASLTTIFDSCNSGTLLDLEHYTCNNVWVPWVNKGQRKSFTLWNRTNRRNACSLGLSPSLSKAPTNRIRTLSVKDLSIEVTVKTFDRPQSRSIGEVLLPLDVITNTDRHEGPPSPASISIPRCSSPVSNDDGISSSYFGEERHRSQSPTSMFGSCDGYCRDRPGRGAADHPHPHVVSISASRDGQLAWGDAEDSMTLSLIEILKETPTPSFHHLMTQLNHLLHTSTMEMHRYALEVKRKSRGGECRASEFEVEMNNFQEPQLGSLSPLNMDDVFTL